MMGRSGSYDELPEINNQLRVVSVAIRTEDGMIHSLPAPARHFQVVQLLTENHGYKQTTMEDQGFLLSDGRFCRRKPAKYIAEKAGQLLDRALDSPYLFSEDVW